MKTSKRYINLGLTVFVLFFASKVLGQFGNYKMEVADFGLPDTSFTRIQKLDDFVYLTSPDQKKIWVHDLSNNITRNLISSNSELFIGRVIKFNDWYLFTLLCDSGISLIKTKNTFQSTEKVYQLTNSTNDAYYSIFPFQNKLYLSPNDLTQIYRMDSTLTDYELFADMGSLGDETGIRGRAYFEYKNQLHFYGYIDGQLVLWVTDGNSNNIRVIKDENGSDILNLRSPLFWNDTLYFSASDGLFKTWKYFGVDAKAENFGDFEYISNDESVRFGNSLILNLWDEDHGTEPWKFDGTVEGTYLLKDINKQGNSSCHSFQVLNGEINFINRNFELGRDEYWESSGEQNETGIVDSLNFISTRYSTVLGNRQFNLYTINRDSSRLEEYVGNGVSIKIKDFKGQLVGGVNQFASMNDDFFLIHLYSSDEDRYTNWVHHVFSGITEMSPLNLYRERIGKTFEWNNILFLREQKSIQNKIYRIYDTDVQIESSEVIDSSEFYNTDICDVVVNVTELTKEDQFLIFPNPTLGRLHVKNPNLIKSRITIINQLGRTLVKKNIEGGLNEINIGLFPHGIYFVKIEDAAGNLLFNSTIHKVE